MSLHKIPVSDANKVKRRKRVARGIGSGMGKTATRGAKGQKARRQIHPGFEGGQSPIQKRMPVKKGFRNINRKEYAVVNLDDLQNLFAAGDTVTYEGLIKTGIISKSKDGVKVLAFGELDKALTVQAHKFSESAKAAIEKAGGTVEVVDKKAPADAEAIPEKPSRKRAAKAQEAKPE
jgi:large subunit ribosomal protein L15